MPSRHQYISSPAATRALLLIGIASSTPKEQCIVDVDADTTTLTRTLTQLTPIPPPLIWGNVLDFCAGWVCSYCADRPHGVVRGEPLIVAHYLHDTIMGGGKHAPLKPNRWVLTNSCSLHFDEAEDAFEFSGNQQKFKRVLPAMYGFDPKKPPSMADAVVGDNIDILTIRPKSQHRLRRIEMKAPEGDYDYICPEEEPILCDFAPVPTSCVEETSRLRYLHVEPDDPFSMEARLNGDDTAQWPKKLRGFSCRAAELEIDSVVKLPPHLVFLTIESLKMDSYASKMIRGCKNLMQLRLSCKFSTCELDKLFQALRAHRSLQDVSLCLYDVKGKPRQLKQTLEKLCDTVATIPNIALFDLRTTLSEKRFFNYNDEEEEEQDEDEDEDEDVEDKEDEKLDAVNVTSLLRQPVLVGCALSASNHG
eukprot:PhM_4_TR9410/c0_g2_i1/m.12591